MPSGAKIYRFKVYNLYVYRRMLLIIQTQKIALGILYRLRDNPKYWRIKRSTLTTIKMLGGWKNTAVGKVRSKGQKDKCAKIYT